MAEEQLDQTADKAEEQEEQVSPDASAENSSDASTPDDSQQQEESDASTEETSEEIILRLENEIAEMKDQFLRKQAEMENFRKRLLREKEDAIGYANRQLLEDIITVIDNFERAIQSSEGAKDFEAFYDGIIMIEKEFLGMLERKWNLKRFDSVGQEFDPQRHEALMLEDSTEHDVQVVLQDFQKGYILKEQVIRAAKVKVANPVESGDDS